MHALPETTVLPTEPPETLARFEASPEDLTRLIEELGVATNGRVTCMPLDDDDDDDEYEDEYYEDEYYDG